MATRIPLQAVEDLLLSVTQSAVPLLSQTSAHILRAGGKRLRPRLVLLAHEATGGEKPDYAVPLAAAVEIIHTATLVHDDINDQGTLRRGHETVNARWGKTYALLTGDFLFTKTYEVMAAYPPRFNRSLAKAALELVEGETLQMHAAKEGKLDRETYYQIIAKKTAALFVACVELGAMAAEASEAYIKALTDYAFDLGMAFQITDDILDLIADAEQTGKTTGIDLKQGRGLAAAQLKSDGKAPDARAALTQRILDGTTLEAVVAMGRAKAQELIRAAQAALDALPASSARDELHALGNYVLERDH